MFCRLDMQSYRACRPATMPQIKRVSSAGQLSTRPPPIWRDDLENSKTMIGELCRRGVIEVNNENQIYIRSLAEKAL